MKSLHTQFQFSMKPERLIFGQRHQIYAQYTANNKKEMVALHHQWLYGTLPLRSLVNVIKFHKANEEGILLFRHMIEDLLKTIYSINIDDGSFSQAVNETEYQKKANKDGNFDFRLGDNNDGITILSLPSKQGKIGYCFMTFCGCDGKYNENVKDYIPYSAKEYLEFYYKEEYEEYDELFIKGMELVKYIDENAQLLTIEEVRAMFPNIAELKY